MIPRSHGNQTIGTRLLENLSQTDPEGLSLDLRLAMDMTMTTIMTMMIIATNLLKLMLLEKAEERKVAVKAKVFAQPAVLLTILQTNARSKARNHLLLTKSLVNPSVLPAPLFQVLAVLLPVPLASL